ncbi:hypothetical protein K1719_014370 [Acacia pycnantha]|nr:hypothetical protein K1719_014370 [Acacia pycnantha]
MNEFELIQPCIGASDNPSDAISTTCAAPTEFACSLSTLLSHFKRLGKIIHGRKSFSESFSSHPKLTIIFWIFLGHFHFPGVLMLISPNIVDNKPNMLMSGAVVPSSPSMTYAKPIKSIKKEKM